MSALGLMLAGAVCWGVILTTSNRPNAMLPFWVAVGCLAVMSAIWG